MNLKMKKPTLCCCFTWIEFIELYFTVAFLLIRKTWDDRLTGKLGRWEVLRNGGILLMRGMIFTLGGLDTPLRDYYILYIKNYIYIKDYYILRILSIRYEEY